ncbi:MULTISPECIES: helix-turn-helix domain-containing protein [Gracilibacillus]|uniref:helix-turn-helix domain-containing protein n=1 Tax=Gracilibacillus TaxID=74385 RepID=UPI000825ADB4|nr:MULTISPECIES: helix-turn-helix domain-containing protein [Gracilibacillus]
MAIGERLKQEREQKKMSLEDVQKSTKIQVRYLDAIEQEKFNVMPGSFYVRAFIKEYATVLGLDPDELMEEYKSDLPFEQQEETIPLSRMSSSKSVSSGKTSRVFSFMPTVIVVLLIIGIVLLVWLFRQGVFTDGDTDPAPTEEENSAGESVTTQPPQEEGNNGAGQDQDTTEDQDENQEEETPEEEEEPATEVTLDSYENGTSNYQLTTNEETIELMIETTNRNWLQVENGASGESLYESTFTSDESPLKVDISELDELYLRFGEPQDITISINGEELELSEEIQPSSIQEAQVEWTQE